MKRSAVLAVGAICSTLLVSGALAVLTFVDDKVVREAGGTVIHYFSGSVVTFQRDYNIKASDETLLVMREWIISHDVYGLRIGGGTVSDAGIQHLEGLRLEWVDIDDLDISDLSVDSLSRVVGLKSVSLCGTSITCRGIDRLLSKSMSIKYVTAYRINLTAPEIEYLVRRHPNVRFRFDTFIRK